MYEMHVGESVTSIRGQSGGSRTVKRVVQCRSLLQEPMALENRTVCTAVCVSWRIKNYFMG